MGQEITHYGAGILFLIFAIKLLWEGNNMKGGEASDELREVEQELRDQERLQNKKRKNAATPKDIELGDVDKTNNEDIMDDNDKIKKRDSSWKLSILIRS